MTKPISSLPPSLRKGIFTAAEAESKGLTRYQIEQKLASGEIERLGRGVYRSAGGDIPQEEWFQIATLWVGKPSAICLISALAYYHLTDEIPRQTWIMVPHSKLSMHRGLRLVRTRTPKWQFGIERHEGFWITNVTRTIVDAFVHSQLIGNNVAIEALKTALEDKKTTIRAVFDLALKFGVGERIRPYLEVLS